MIEQVGMNGGNWGVFNRPSISKSALAISAIALLILSNLPIAEGGELSYQGCVLACRNMWQIFSMFRGEGISQGMISKGLMWLVGGAQNYCSSVCAPAKFIPWL